MVFYFIVSFFIFFLGIGGFIFVRFKHIILLLIAIELMLLSIIFNLILFSIFLNDLIGQLFCLIILVIAAAEMALGLSILMVYFRFRGDILLNLIILLKG